MLNASNIGMGLLSTGVVSTALYMAEAPAVSLAAGAAAGVMATTTGIAINQLKTEAVRHSFPDTGTFRLATLWARGVASSVVGRTTECGLSLDNLPLTQRRRDCIYANSLVEDLLRQAMASSAGYNRLVSVITHSRYADANPSQEEQYREALRHWPDSPYGDKKLSIRELTPFQIMDIFNLLFYLAGLDKTELSDAIDYDVKLELLKNTGIVRELKTRVVSSLGTSRYSSPYEQEWGARTEGDYAFAADQLYLAIIGRKDDCVRFRP